VPYGLRPALTPVAALAATYETKRYGFNLIGIPPGCGSSGALFGVK